MSMVLWASLETDTDDFMPDDLFSMFDKLEALDARCDQLQVKKLSELVDNSDLEFNMSDEDLGEDWLVENANWMHAAELLKTLQAMETALKDSEEDDDEQLLEEIQYAVGRFVEAEKNNTRVRLLALI